uniref:Uncharacterized protein n=1 Tax=Glossina pallidipes TaxID=7398 RepID=A0A1B0A294_GLOPL
MLSTTQCLQDKEEDKEASRNPHERNLLTLEKVALFISVHFKDETSTIQIRSSDSSYYDFSVVDIICVAAMKMPGNNEQLYRKEMFGERELVMLALYIENGT